MTLHWKGYEQPNVAFPTSNRRKALDCQTRTSVPTSATRTTARKPNVMTNQEAMKLALEALGEILESFEKDGKFCMSSLIRNELFDRLKVTFDECKAIAEAEQEQGEPEMNSNTCAGDVFEHGTSMGLFVMSKDEAEQYCKDETKRTGYKHDWHYVAGRVHVKALIPTQQRKPLTDEQIVAIVREASLGSAIRRDGSTSLRIARAIEAAHNIFGDSK